MKYFTLTRKEFGSGYTMGKLDFEGVVLCDTLEDEDRDLTFEMTPEYISGKKVYGQTAIPYGTYPITVSYSTRFEKELPEIKGVPGFSGIRCHSGNTPADTLGCVLLGERNGPGFIHNCKPYVDSMIATIKEVEKEDQCSITIKR